MAWAFGSKGRVVSEQGLGRGRGAIGLSVAEVVGGR